MPPKQNRLHAATLLGDTKHVKSLLKKGMRVNAKTKNGGTALHLAVKRGHAKIVEVLLAKKANVNAVDKHNRTPLHEAAIECDPTLVKMLLGSGANVSAKLENGCTALHVASTCYNFIDIDEIYDYVSLSSPIDVDYEAVVEALLAHGADIEAKENGGKTALFLAAQYACPEAVKILVDHGADVNVICDKSVTPLERARFSIDNYINRRGEKACRNEILGLCGGTLARFLDVGDFLAERIIAMMALDLYVSEDNIMSVDHFYEHRTVLDPWSDKDTDLKAERIAERIAEVSCMKTKKIGDSIVTYYGILTASMDKLVRYTENTKIVEALEPRKVVGDFPCYSRMISQRVKHGQKRKNLEDGSLKSLTDLSGYVFPVIVTTKLFNYLNNEDLMNLTKAELKLKPKS